VWRLNFCFVRRVCFGGRRRITAQWCVWGMIEGIRQERENAERPGWANNEQRPLEKRAGGDRRQIRRRTAWDFFAAGSVLRRISVFPLPVDFYKSLRRRVRHCRVQVGRRQQSRRPPPTHTHTYTFPRVRLSPDTVFLKWPRKRRAYVRR